MLLSHAELVNTQPKGLTTLNLYCTHIYWTK